MGESIHLLEKQIHSNYDIASFTGHAFNSSLASLLSDYPSGNSQNFHLYSKAIKELNKKLSQFNLSSDIVSPIGAGFRPTNLTNFFGTLKPARSQSNLNITNFATTWSSDNRQVRAVASGTRSSDQTISLLSFNSSHFSLGKYLITFDVTQASGTTINDKTHPSSTRSRIEIISRDNDGVADSDDNLNKDRFGVRLGSNSITTTVFDDGTSNNKPKIQLFFKRDAIFDVTISNINLRYVSY